MFATSEFPSEIPRTQTRNYPYTKPLVTSAHLKILYGGIWNSQLWAQAERKNGTGKSPKVDFPKLDGILKIFAGIPTRADFLKKFGTGIWKSHPYGLLTLPEFKNGL